MALLKGPTKAGSDQRARLATKFGVAGSSPVFMMASPSGKSSDHGSMPIGTRALGLPMYEPLTLFGLPTIWTLIPIALRLLWMTSAMLTNPGASFWHRSTRVIGVLMPDSDISFLAIVRSGVL